MTTLLDEYIKFVFETWLPKDYLCGDRLIHMLDAMQDTDEHKEINRRLVAYEEAVKACEEALKEAPDTPEVMYIEAQSLLKTLKEQL